MNQQSEPVAATVGVASTEMTFVFTDIERSMQAWDRSPDVMMATLDRQEEVVRRAVTTHGGQLIGDGGDGWCMVFASPVDAIRASVEAQRHLEQLDPDPHQRVRVRFGIHTGTPVVSAAGEFRGPPLNLAGRLHKAVHGGQIVASSATYKSAADGLPAGIKLASIGRYRLRDLPPADYYQVYAEGLQKAFPPLVALNHTDGRLPVPPTPLIGRQAEINQLAQLVQPGILTLTGIGGIGKTRLALALAEEVIGEYADGVVACDFGSIPADGQASDVVAAALGIDLTSRTDPIGRIVEYMAPKRLVLLLDNCEHVLAGASAIAAAARAHCPHTLVLATSRVRLNVEGETDWPVGPLAVGNAPPAGSAWPGPPAAVELFLARALVARPAWSPGEADQAHIQSICVRLDGIPLAIELAAAQIRYVDPAELEARLANDISMLDSRRPSPLRRPTLVDLIRWSYDQLDPALRRTIRGLSVFAGGFTLAAAEAVVQADPGDDESLVAHLSELIDRSLIQRIDQVDGTTRYQLLETIRTFCRTQVTDEGAEDLAERHLRYYLDVAEEAAPRLRADSEEIAVGLIDAEFANLRVAHATAVANDDAERAGRLVIALTDYCFVRLHYELYSWVERTLAICDASSPGLPELYGIAATGAFLRGDLAETERLARRGLAAETTERESFHPRFMLAVAAGYAGRPAEAGDWIEQALQWCVSRNHSYYRAIALVTSAIGLCIDGKAEFGGMAAEMALESGMAVGNPTCIAWATYARAEALRATEPATALDLLSTALEIALGVHGAFIEGFALGARASLNREKGNLVSAAADLLRLLDHWTRAGHRPQEWLTLREAQLLLSEAGKPNDAAVISGALSRRTVIPPTAKERALITAAEEAMDLALGSTGLQHEQSRGAVMSDAQITQATRDALRRVILAGGPDPSPPASRIHGTASTRRPR